MKAEIMRMQAASNTPCTLVQSRPSASVVKLRLISGNHFYLKKSRATTRCDLYQIEPRITYVDRAIIRGYFRQQDFLAPLHPANMKALFPEFRKYLLPDDLECRLSILPARYCRILISSDVLLIETTSRMIVDVLRDIYATL